MRRLVYLFVLPLLLSTNKSEAQSFSTEKDTFVVASHSYTEMENNITNHTSSGIIINWRIITETLPQSWKDNGGFGLCDNVTCYDKGILAGSTQTMDTISGGTQSLFKVQLNLSPTSVTPTGATPVYIIVELSDGTTTDTTTFAVYKWGANVSKINNGTNDEVVLYPNPAYNEVNVTFGKDMGVRNVAIYNLVGKQISSYRVSTNSAKLDLGKVPSGIYFLRLIDSNGRVVATRRFTHQ